MCRISQAGAVAALKDQDWLKEVQENVRCARERIWQIASDNGLKALPSSTNFVTLDCGRDGAFARRVLGYLIDSGVFVRMPFVAPQDRCIRVSCGTSIDLDVFAAALPNALERAKSG